MSDRRNDQLASALFDAEKERREIERITITHPQLNVDNAYEIVEELIQLKQDQGGVLAGYKLGYTSQAMQRQMGIQHPSFGYLFKDMFIDTGDSLHIDALIHPKLEAEIAFVLKHDLQGPGVTEEDVIQATDYVMPVLEVVDSRYKNYHFTAVDVIADNNSAARVVVGEQRLSPHAVDLSEVQVDLKANGKTAVTGHGKDVLGNPIKAIVWLANFCAAKGMILKKGQVIISGGMTKAIDLHVGDDIRADFQDFGTVQLEVV